MQGLLYVIDELGQTIAELKQERDRLKQENESLIQALNGQARPNDSSE